MKALVVSSTAVFFCLLILIGNVYAQPTYVCKAFEGCPTVCQQDDGQCPASGPQYHWVQTRALTVHSCVDGGNGCDMNQSLPYCQSWGYLEDDCTDIQCALDNNVPQCSTQ
jgi:hypothetical protein